MKISIYVQHEGYSAPKHPTIVEVEDSLTSVANGVISAEAVVALKQAFSTAAKKVQAEIVARTSL